MNALNQSTLRPETLGLVESFNRRLRNVALAEDAVVPERFRLLVPKLIRRFAGRITSATPAMLDRLARALARELVAACREYHCYHDPELAQICIDLRLQRRLVATLNRAKPHPPALQAA